MRLPYGLLKELEKETGIKKKILSDHVATRKRPSRKRALFLEAACFQINRKVPAATWMFGSSDEIKNALINNVLEPAPF